MNTSDEWIKERSGITERRWVEEESNASILAIEAAKNAMEDASLTAADLS
ncbi:MAG: hypothetical protein CM1200mP10_02160 [Candidatus Neomarinimicrobiota bacterium]|nr:MAG: hypothetical protein CM1200mP10_02160 [Candidatus Neomarinimicrobiota bacterium]